MDQKRLPVKDNVVPTLSVLDMFRTFFRAQSLDFRIQ